MCCSSGLVSKPSVFSKAYPSNQLVFEAPDFMWIIVFVPLFLFEFGNLPKFRSATMSQYTNANPMFVRCVVQSCFFAQGRRDSDGANGYTNYGYATVDKVCQQYIYFNTRTDTSLLHDYDFYFAPVQTETNGDPCCWSGKHVTENNIGVWWWWLSAEFFVHRVFCRDCLISFRFDFPIYRKAGLRRRERARYVSLQIELRHWLRCHHKCLSRASPFIMWPLSQTHCVSLFRHAWLVSLTMTKPRAWPILHLFLSRLSGGALWSPNVDGCSGRFILGTTWSRRNN